MFWTLQMPLDPTTWTIKSAEYDPESLTRAKRPYVLVCLPCPEMDVIGPQLDHQSVRQSHSCDIPIHIVDHLDLHDAPLRIAILKVWPWVIEQRQTTGPATLPDLSGPQAIASMNRVVSPALEHHHFDAVAKAESLVSRLKRGPTDAFLPQWNQSTPYLKRGESRGNRNHSS
jgi:hypothetical protein